VWVGGLAGFPDAVAGLLPSSRGPPGRRPDCHALVSVEARKKGVVGTAAPLRSVFSPTISPGSGELERLGAIHPSNGAIWRESLAGN